MNPTHKKPPKGPGPMPVGLMILVGVLFGVFVVLLCLALFGGNGGGP